VLTGRLVRLATITEMTRLRLCGHRVADLYAGRGLALVASGLGLAAPYLALIAADQKVTRLGAIAATLTLTITIAAPLGTLLGAAVPRELEGTLLLIALVGAQMITDPANPAAKLMPFWSAREIATYSIDNVDDAYLHRGLAHGIGYAATLTALTAVITTVRLRQRHHSEITAPGRRRSTARPTTQ
jgi:hypothetical protein